MSKFRAKMTTMKESSVPMENNKKNTTPGIGKWKTACANTPAKERYAASNTIVCRKIVNMSHKSFTKRQAMIFNKHLIKVD